MDTLRTQISNYTPVNQNETSDREVILHCIDTYPNILTRENPVCHFTASCWIVNPSHTKALMLFHNIQQAWMWPGGHADGESDLAKVALREAHEETSLSSIHFLDDNIFSLEIFAVPPHIRREKFVSSHIHLNCSFLFKANETEAFKVKPDENSAIRWMTFAEIEEQIQKGLMEKHFQRLIDKTKKL